MTSAPHETRQVVEMEPVEQTADTVEGETPASIPARGWKDIALRSKDEIKSDNVTLLAAGVAFYALLSLVPALIAVVSLYGMVADPEDVDRQVSSALAAAPTEVRELVSSQLAAVTESTDGGLGIAFAVGLVVALWSASSGVKHLISAINVAYDEEETRGFVALRARCLLFTIGAILFLIVAVGVITALPALLDDTALDRAAQVTVSVLRWPLLGAGLVAALSVLYRYGPDRSEPKWNWTGPGTIFASVAWVAASIGFSVYTSNFASYGETYGSLGAIVVVMLWLMISAVVVIVGAEINAEVEKQVLTRRASREKRRR